MERTPLAVEKAPTPKPVIQVKQVERYVPSCKFFSTGSSLLDLALGGGWAHPFIFNLVGDRSSGKTLLGIEAFANFERAFKEAQMRYAETESRFDAAYAATLGFPLSVKRPDNILETFEDFRDDLYDFIWKCKPESPGLYILDSLDALSDEAELKKYEKSQKTGRSSSADSDEEEEGEGKAKGSFGTAKAKGMSAMFRMFNKDMSKNGVTLGIISQLRDNVGVSFGETSTRSGGRALNYYSSQIVWLREEGKKTQTEQGETRATGVDTHAKVKKCSVGMPFREARFPIRFGYGVEDESSLLNWLGIGGKYPAETVKELKKKLKVAMEKQDYATLDELHNQLKLDAVRVWNDIEKGLAPTIRKYR